MEETNQQVNLLPNMRVISSRWFWTLAFHRRFLWRGVESRPFPACAVSTLPWFHSFLGTSRFRLVYRQMGKVYMA